MKTLSQYRVEARYSRNALAKVLKVAPSLLFAIEHGTTPMPERLVDPWAKALSAPRDEIARHVGGALRLIGLSPPEREQVINLAEGLKAGRAA